MQPLNSIVLTTAGHVDHGKTALVEALTGMRADRLPEERKRGMTIDVGYAHMTLSHGEIDFVDVPGHEDLLNNMIVGASEADGFLLVVDCAEGVRPQTLEHLGVMRALKLDHGVAAMTKIDIADRSRTRRSVADVKSMLCRADISAEVVPVSSRTGEGLDELRAALSTVHARILGDGHSHASRSRGTPLLPIDRAFGVRGRGTIVTGTLRGGCLTHGQILSLEPDGVRTRVVELQRHGGRIHEFCGSGRVAVRLRGVRPERLERGRVLAAPGGARSGDRALVLLGFSGPAPRQQTHVTMHVGTDRVAAVVARTWNTPDGRLVRLRLARRVALIPGARVVVRRSGGVIDGGPVLDAGDGRQFGRLSEHLAARLATGASRGIRGLAAGLLDVRGALADAELGALAELNPEDVERELERSAIHAGHVWLSERFNAELQQMLSTYAIKAGEVGFSLADGRQRIARALAERLPHRAADAVAASEALVEKWVDQGHVVQRGSWLFHPLSKAARGASDQELTALLTILSSPAPPRLPAAVAAAGCSHEQARELERQGVIVRVGTDIAYSAETYRNLVTAIEGLALSRPITPSITRDAIHTSRNYAVALLEHLDSIGLLVRTPRGHVLRRSTVE